MKRIFWIFIIRGKIKRAIARTEKEKTYYGNILLKSPLPPDEARYGVRMIELKEEVIRQLKMLL